MEAIKQKITDLLKEKFLSEEYSDCFIVDITISKSSRVQVFVDCDKGVNLVTCTKLSRHLESWLDESLALGEKYTLEVSSPGVERPLIKRQYPKNIGRNIRVKLKEGKIVEGKLTGVGDTEISIEYAVSKKENATLDISFEEIEESIIIVSF